MKLIEAGEIHREEYERFVSENQSGSFLQSFDWGQWQISLNREVLRFIITDEKGGTVGVVQCIKMKLPFGRYYVYCPYGPVMNGGAGELQEVIMQLRLLFADAVCIRIEPKSTIPAEFLEARIDLYKSKNIQPARTLVIDITKPAEELLSQMHSKTRYNIKVAMKHGVEIKDEFSISNGHGLFFDEALQLISDTAKRQGFKTFTEDYYKQMVDFFALHHKGKLQLHVYKAIYNNTLLATAIMLDYGDVRTFLFGGSFAEYKNVMAPYLLHYKAMTDAQLLGMKSYDFWGIETSSGETPGFVRFKLGFGGNEKQYAGAYDIVVSKLWYTVYRIVRNMYKFLKQK